MTNFASSRLDIGDRRQFRKTKSDQRARRHSIADAADRKRLSDETTSK